MPSAKKPELKKVLQNPEPEKELKKSLGEKGKPEYNWLVIPRGALDLKTRDLWKNDRNVEETFNNFIADGFVIDKFTATPNEFVFVWKKGGQYED